MNTCYDRNARNRTDSPEHLAAVALQEATGNYGQAMERMRLALKVLSRWKLLDVIDGDSASAEPLLFGRLSDGNAPVSR